MNSKLKDRTFKIPPNVINFLRQQPEIEGLKRNKALLEKGEVTYGQMKRILHDLKKTNKITERKKYDYYGGDLMYNWALNTLRMERSLINDREDATRIANDIAGLTGERKNPSIKRKKSSFLPNLKMKPPTNLLKSNSSSFSFASLFSPKALKLFEDMEKKYEGACRCFTSGYVDNGNNTTTCTTCNRTWDHKKYGAQGRQNRLEKTPLQEEINRIKTLMI